MVANVRIRGSQAGPPVPTEGYLAVSPLRQSVTTGRHMPECRNGRIQYLKCDAGDMLRCSRIG
jgi:hypothetical protein